MIMMMTMIIKIILIIITTIKRRGRYRTPSITNMELLVTLHNGQKPLSNIKKSSPSDAARALYMPLKRLIHHLTFEQGQTKPLGFLAWNSPPLDFSSITVTVILIKITIIIIIIIMIIIIIIIIIITVIVKTITIVII